MLIEKDQLGGTCLNRGCIPTKSLLQSAAVYETVQKAQTFGVSAGKASFDYGKVAARKDAVVGKLRQGIAYLEKKAGVTVLSGEAAFVDKNTLSVGGETIGAQNVIIATGSTPARPPIPGMDTAGVIDSDAALALTECPQSVVIIGGGVIGVEFATLFRALGAAVTIIEMLPQILPPVDGQIAALMRKSLEKRGVTIHTGARVEKIEAGPTVHFDKDGKHSVSAQLCIVAVGRRPVTDGLNLQKIGVAMTRGFVDVDEYLQTSVPGIYAIGDVTGKVQLAHVASAQGLVAAANIAGQRHTMNYDIVPSCVYTEPEIAGVGLTEQQAKDKGIKVRIGKFVTAANGRSMIMDEAEGLVKIHHRLPHRRDTRRAHDGPEGHRHDRRDLRRDARGGNDRGACRYDSRASDRGRDDHGGPRTTWKASACISSTPITRSRIGWINRISWLRPPPSVGIMMDVKARPFVRGGKKSGGCGYAEPEQRHIKA